MAQNSTPQTRRAVVIGGSMTGLAVARALSEHFDEVVLVDKDRFPADVPEHRRGVQQSYHIHNLTLRGQQELDELFPGFTDAAIALGAVPVDHGADIVRCTELGWQPLFHTGHVALSATRILLEFAERQRFRALNKNITVLEETLARELITEPRGNKVRAVGITTNHEDPQYREIRGELVVDCAGRGTKWKKWFESAGVPLPKETVVDSRCGYSSRFYRPRNPEQFPWKGMVVDTVFPDQPCWGVIVPLENQEWVVTLGGFSGQFPPKDEDGFVEFARKLQSPLYIQALEQADPISPVRTFRRMEMRWNHFEKYDHRMERFLAIGDSTWAYNPLYGQGMSIGITCARILRDVLRKDGNLDTLARRYYPPARKFAFPPWEATALRDLRWPGATGKRPWHGPLTLPLSELIMQAGHYDREIFYSLLQGIHLLKSPEELITPAFGYRVLRHITKRVVSSLPPPNFGVLPAPPEPAEG